MEAESPSRLATFWLKQIQEKKVNPRDLNSHQRKVCVRFMLHEGKWTEEEISEIMGVGRHTIMRDKKKVYEQDGWMIERMDVNRMILDFKRAKDIAVVKLRLAGKYKDAFEVEEKYLNKMQDLGYVKRAPLEITGELAVRNILDYVAKRDEQRRQQGLVVEPEEGGNGSFNRTSGIGLGTIPN